MGASKQLYERYGNPPHEASAYSEMMYQLMQAVPPPVTTTAPEGTVPGLGPIGQASNKNCKANQPSAI